MMNQTTEMINNHRRQDMLRAAEKHRAAQSNPPAKTQNAVLAGLGKTLSSIGETLQERYGDLSTQSPITTAGKFQQVS